MYWAQFGRQGRDHSGQMLSNGFTEILAIDGLTFSGKVTGGANAGKGQYGIRLLDRFLPLATDPSYY
jgi:hypothetical protein